MNEGYPTESELMQIETWPHTDFHGLFSFIEPLWSHYGRLTRKKNKYDLATGGWSGNESIISAMRDNRVFWCVCWQLSERGGHYIFEVPAAAAGKGKK